MAARRSRECCWVRRPMRTMKTGMRGMVRTTATVEARSWVSMTRATAGVTVADMSSWGR